MAHGSKNLSHSVFASIRLRTLVSPRYSIKLNIYLESELVAVCIFSSLAIDEPAAWHCEPDGVLSHLELENLVKRLRRCPVPRSGKIGKYRWVEE